MYLFADNSRRFWTRMDQNYRRKYEHLLQAEDPRWTQVDISRPMPEIDPRAHSVLLVGVFGALRSSEDPPGAYVPEDWFQNIRKRCVMVEDMHPRCGRPLSSHFEGRFDYLIATYDCAGYEELRGKCRSIRKSWIIPHHIDTTVYRPMNRPRNYDVLLYGNTDPSTYPFRHRLRRILAQSSLRVKIVECPDVRWVDKEFCGEPLSRLINESFLAIATPSKHDYLLAKYFEIAACGTLVAGPMASQGKAIWKDRYLQLEEDLTDAEILERLAGALDHEDQLIAAGLAMSEVIHADYSLDQYVKRLNGVMEEIAADESKDPIRFIRD